MGRDKALLTFEGQPLIRHVYDTAAACSDRVVVVTPWPDRYRLSLPAACRYAEEPFCDRPQGPLVGFCYGLGAVDTEWVLLLACDLPHLCASTLQVWADLLAALPAQTVALLPRSDRWEPLCGFYRSRSRQSLSRFIDAGGRSFQQWLSQQQVCPIALQEAQAKLLYNCNTPEDWSEVSQDAL